MQGTVTGLGLASAGVDLGGSVALDGGRILFPSNLVVAAIGDSLCTQSVGANTYNGFVEQDYRGALPWARALIGQRAYLPGAAIKGVGGNRLDQILARITDVTAMSIADHNGGLVQPGTVVLNGGGNDIGQGAPLATVIARLDDCIGAIRDAGQNVVFIGPTPQASSTSWTGTQLGILADFRDYCRSRARPAQGVLVADAWNDLAATPDGDVATATMLRDSVHWHPKAAYLVGLRLAAQLDKFFPDPRPLPGTNLLANPELSGTSGSKTAGITGSVATGWNATSNGAGSGDAAVAATKIDLGGGQYAQQFHVTGTWASGGDIGMNQTLTGWGTTYTVGDIMSFDATIEVDAITPAPTSRHIAGVHILFKSGTTVSDARIAAAEPTPANTAMGLNLRVERFTHGADSTRNTPQFNYVFPAGTHDFAVRFKLPKYIRH